MFELGFLKIKAQYTCVLNAYSLGQKVTFTHACIRFDEELRNLWLEIEKNSNRTGYEIQYGREVKNMISDVKALEEDLKD